MPTPASVVTDKRVAVMVADGLEEVECLAVVDVLFRAGIGADLLSISDSLEVTSSHGIHFRCDALASQVDLASYALMFLPGGMPGTLNLGASALVIDEVRRRSAAGQPLAAICAAPSILAEHGALQARRATANPDFMDAIAAGGALMSEAAVVRDANLITSRGMGTATELGFEIIRLLLDDDAEQVVASVKQGIVYQR